MTLKSVNCILCENPFGRYCVPKSSAHRPASQTVLRGQVWELETLQFMRDHAFDRDIIHAGMYFGDFLPGLASALAPRRAVYGFEPNPENFACAQWTSLLNGLTNLTMQKAGLGEERKSAAMRTFERGRAIGGGSHIINDFQQGVTNNADIDSVDVVAIDEILPAGADIGIIQLDIEGYEKFALRGGIKTIKKHRPIIILETVPHDYVEEHLLPLGYRSDREICSNTIFMP